MKIDFTRFYFVCCRKGALLINNVFAILAALLMGLSYPTGLFELLIIGRLFTGINAGKSFTNTLTGPIWGSSEILYITLDMWWDWVSNCFFFPWECLDFAYQTFYFCRHRHLCSASLFGGNSSDSASWCHGNGNLHFHHWWDLNWTSDWSQVNTGNISFNITQNYWKCCISFCQNLGFKVWHCGC